MGDNDAAATMYAASIALSMDRVVMKGHAAARPIAKRVLFCLTRALAEGTTSMWEHAPEAPGVTQLLTEVVDAARRTVHPDTHPAFHAEYDGFMPEGAPIPFLLWSRALTVRYLRADAHAIALNEARMLQGLETLAV